MNDTDGCPSDAAIAPGARALAVGAGRRRYRGLFLHCEYRAQDFGQEPSSVGHSTALDYESHITAVPVPDASSDVVLGTEVLEHVPEPIPAVQEMSRILKPGGMLIVKALLGGLYKEPYHFWLLTGICARFAALAAGLARGTGLE